MDRFDSDFVPYTFQLPISVAVGKISADFRLLDLVVLDEPQFRPPVLTEHFWRGWEKYRRPTLVSFNGRTFDLPLMELAAFRYGVSVPGWFNVGAKSFEQYRNRFNLDAHIDLQEILTNFGSTRFTGGLNLAANLLGKPGKMDVQGHMVQDLFDQGQLSLINDYCRCDLLDTYFVFLPARVLFGADHAGPRNRVLSRRRKPGSSKGRIRCRRIAFTWSAGATGQIPGSDSAAEHRHLAGSRRV